MFGALVESDDIEGALLIDTQQARRSAPHTSHPLPTQPLQQLPFYGVQPQFGCCWRAYDPLPCPCPCPVRRRMLYVARSAPALASTIDLPGRDATVSQVRCACPPNDIRTMAREDKSSSRDARSNQIESQPPPCPRCNPSRAGSNPIRRRRPPTTNPARRPCRRLGPCAHECVGPSGRCAEAGAKATCGLRARAPCMSAPFATALCAWMLVRMVCLKGRVVRAVRVARVTAHVSVPLTLA